MIVVGDSGPLHYLILIDLIDLLPRLYGTVLIPPAVFSELTATSTPRKVASWVSHPPEWLQVRPVSRDAIRGITEDLDDGEREAIRLAVELKADLLLMDEADGRSLAIGLGLPVTGTLGLLERADVLGVIADLPAALADLEASGFYLSARLRDAVLDRYRRRHGIGS
jgi:predicted nucleic acid-binding protein